MKRSQLLAVSVLALLLLTALPVQIVRAQSPYSEKLNVYIAGTDALWYLTFSGVNGSGHLSALESTPGLSWYNVTAISTAGWQPDFQVFGPRGYNLLPVPYQTPQGIFLTVGSDTYPDASAAAGAMGQYLLTNFVSYSNGTGAYTFYSPVSFSKLIPATLLKFLPTGEHGFAGAVNPSGLASSASPFVVLEGKSSGAVFDHTLVVGSISPSALSSSGVPTLLSYFAPAVTSLQASANSTSSTVQINTLDGIIQSSDHQAAVTSNPSTFTGSYTLALAPGKKISGVNATVLEQPAPLLATRAIDTGVLRTGTTLAVTLTFTNLSPTDTITDVTYADSWWNATGSFNFLGGSDNLTAAVLTPGATTTPVYRLQYTGSATGPMTIPASVVHYQYQANGKNFTGATVLNPITVSQGADDAVVYAIITPSGTLGKPVGSSQHFNITVFNVGTLPASTVVVAGTSIPGLAAKSGSSPGGTQTVAVTQSASSITDVNATRSYEVTYQDPSGNNLQAATNVVTDLFSHVNMVTGFPVLTLGASVSPISAGVNNLTLSFASSNLGHADVTAYNATGTAPAGLGCGKVSGPGISCAGGLITISYADLAQSTTQRSYISYNVTSPANYIVAPFRFVGITSGESVAGESNLAAAPAGLQLAKTFAPAQLFGGMSSAVSASAVNAGTLPFYNASITTTADSFDTVTSVTPLTKAVQTIASGGNVTIAYAVSTSQAYGNLSSTPVTASFYFGGTSFTVQGLRSKVQIYQPPSVSIGTTPVTPEEGKSFVITFTITNPSGVAVSDVQFTLPIPSGVTLSGLQNAGVSSGKLTVSVGTLAAGSNATASATAVASSGITIPFANAKLTFSYSGATVSGVVPKSSGIAIAENVTTRYLIPTAIILLVMLGVAFYVRRLASSGPASPR